MKLKRFYAAMLAAVMILVMSVSVFAAGSVSMVQISSAGVGQIFGVELYAGAETDAVSLDVMLVYDTSSLSFVQAVGGTFSRCEYTNSGGVVVISCSGIYNTALSGSIATLYFTVLEQPSFSTQITAVVTNAVGAGGGEVTVNGFTMPVSFGQITDDDVTIDEQEPDADDIDVSDSEEDEEIIIVDEQTQAVTTEEEVTTRETTTTRVTTTTRATTTTHETATQATTTAPATTTTFPTTTSVPTSAITSITSPAETAAASGSEILEQANADSSGRATGATVSVAVLAIAVTVAAVVGIEYIRRNRK